MVNIIKPISGEELMSKLSEKFEAIDHKCTIYNLAYFSALIGSLVLTNLSDKRLNSKECFEQSKKTIIFKSIPPKQPLISYDNYRRF